MTETFKDWKPCEKALNMRAVLSVSNTNTQTVLDLFTEEHRWIVSLTAMPSLGRLSPKSDPDVQRPTRRPVNSGWQA